VRDALILAAVALAACGAGMSDFAQASRQITISGDNGGSVREYIARAERLRAEGVPVVIAGACHSACAMIASLPNACLGPRAKVGLHWPYVKLGGTVAGPDALSPWFDRVTPQIAQAVRAMPFDYTRAGHIQLTVTAANAAQYGLRAC
jgi:hypothetical protein